MPLYVSILFLQISCSIYLVFNFSSSLNSKFIKFIYATFNSLFTFFTLVIILILATDSLDMDYEYSMSLSILILVLSVVLSIYNHKIFYKHQITSLV